MDGTLWNEFLAARVGLPTCLALMVIVGVVCWFGSALWGTETDSAARFGFKRKSRPGRNNPKRL